MHCVCFAKWQGLLSMVAKTAGGKARRLPLFVLALEDVLLRFTYQAPTCVPLFALLLTLATRQPTKLSQAY